MNIKYNSFLGDLFLGLGSLSIGYYLGHNINSNFDPSTAINYSLLYFAPMILFSLKKGFEKISKNDSLEKRLNVEVASEFVFGSVIGELLTVTGMLFGYGSSFY